MTYYMWTWIQNSIWGPKETVSPQNVLFLVSVPTTIWPLNALLPRPHVSCCQHGIAVSLQPSIRSVADGAFRPGPHCEHQARLFTCSGPDSSNTRLCLYSFAHAVHRPYFSVLARLADSLSWQQPACTYLHRILTADHSTCSKQRLLHFYLLAVCLVLAHLLG